MKLLLVTWYFPPTRTIAAVRLGKLARYLLAQGHDLRVLTPQDPPLPQDRAVDFPAERVIRTPWRAAQGGRLHLLAEPGHGPIEVMQSQIAERSCSRNDWSCDCAPTAIEKADAQTTTST